MNDRMRYNASLDGLRALAALTIAFYHAHVPAMPGGFFGVDIFFVLSGYLITRLLVDEYHASGTVQLRRFVARRLRRLYPALLLMLLVYLLIAPLVFAQVSFGKHLLDTMWSALYLANYASAFGFPMSMLGHVWSLAVEVQFYLLWPLLFLLLVRMPRLWVVGAIALLYLLASGWRWWSFDHASDPWLIYTRADTHCSGLLLGCLLGYLNPRRIHRYWIVVAVVALFFAVTFFSWPWGTTARFGFPLVEVCAALLILSQPKWLGWRPLAWFGRISYGFYLWHFLMMRVLQEWQWHWLEVFLMGSLAGLVMATLCYYLVERRFHRAWFERTAPAVKVGSAPSAS
ncbi:acyltransferase family protein [Zestomonas carbonaria]|uniref:O-acetyltransferase OatA n=1 Tax=Zestomonas carbonaria TaxID=2762745 RepID=A0A7U7EN59_9GAMM|nr:acyltransferase [Pseudomonas carbonaria]CAD5107956.1 O-acetyltransferase OatA [Pseudomonas carbonaria]